MNTDPTEIPRNIKVFPSSPPPPPPVVAPPVPKLTSKRFKPNQTIYNLAPIPNNRQHIPSKMLWRVTGYIWDDNHGEMLVTHPWGEPENEMHVPAAEIHEKFKLQSL
jgi:hypothetical protein